jgi:hypothetical protein
VLGLYVWGSGLFWLAAWRNSRGQLEPAPEPAALPDSLALEPVESSLVRADQQG